MFLLLALLQQIDSTVPVQRGQRLEVSVYAGTIAVKTWNRDAVRVVGETDGRATVEIDQSATVVEVQTHGRGGPPPYMDLQVTAPPWMTLDLSGVNTSVTVAGARGGITVETVQGEVDVEGGVGLVTLQSVQGRVSLRGAKGRLEAHSVNEDVSVGASSGEVTAETVNGDITLSRVDGTSVTVTSVNGDLHYDGTIRNGGRYAFSTHNGGITLAVAEGTNAAISVSTFSGDFTSEFPVALTESRKGRRLSFTLGSGSAQVTLESFQGSIELVRPGSSRGARNHDPNPK